MVADEVRKLAEKTMSATAEVGQSIRGIQEGTRKSASGVHEAVAVIEDATGLAEQSGQALDAIVQSGGSGLGSGALHRRRLGQQSAASEAIEGSIVAVNEVSQETAQAMEHATTAAATWRTDPVVMGLIADLRGEQADRALTT